MAIQPQPDGIVIRPARLWAMVLGLALAIGVLEAIQIAIRWSLTGYPGTIPQAVLASIPPWLALAAFTPGIWWLAGRFRLDRPNRLRTILVHGIASVVFAGLSLGVHALNAATLGGMVGGAGEALQHLAGIYVVSRILTYWSILAAFQAVFSFRENRERANAAIRLEGELAKAKLEALRAQLNPHFLFNTLGSISTLALRGDGEAVIDALSMLSEMLRTTLKANTTEEVPLVDEISFTERYVDLQRLRYGDRLSLSVDLSPAAEQELVPAMLLQPLVENAIEHGVAQVPGPGSVTVTGRMEDTSLVLRIEDTGPGITAERGEGVGLSNTEARLSALYGRNASFMIRARSTGGTAVTIKIGGRK